MRLTLWVGLVCFFSDDFCFAPTFAFLTTFVSLHSSAETSFLLDDSYIRFPLPGRSWRAGKASQRWKATQRWHVRQQEAPARTRPSALFFIGTLSQTLTLRAAFSSSTYLLPQIPGPGRSSDDDLRRNLQITEYQVFNRNQSWIFGNSENA